LSAVIEYEDCNENEVQDHSHKMGKYEGRADYSWILKSDSCSIEEWNLSVQQQKSVESEMHTNSGQLLWSHFYHASSKGDLDDPDYRAEMREKTKATSIDQFVHVVAEDI
jgi:hypothetical protein